MRDKIALNSKFFYDDKKNKYQEKTLKIKIVGKSQGKKDIELATLDLNVDKYVG